MNSLIIDELIKKYKLGERNFSKLDLRYLNLSGINLRNINLEGSNLEGSNLEGSNLEGSNLKGSNLEGSNLTYTNLNYANLKEANLQKVYLSYASLKNAILNGVNLYKSYLNCANLEKSQLQNANLRKIYFNQSNLSRVILNDSNLTGAYLIGADLSYASLKRVNLCDACLVGVKGIKKNFFGAFYNETTQFPSNFNPRDFKMVKTQIITMKELICSFVCVYELSCKYLGSNITQKNWQISCPNKELLQQFSLNNQKKIIFLGNSSQLINEYQQVSFKKWLQNFIALCSNIIHDFNSLLKQCPIN